MRAVLIFVLLLLAAPMSALSVAADGAAYMDVQILKRFHLSSDEVHVTVIANDVAPGSELRLEWTLFEGSLQTGTAVQNGSLERLATGSTKSMGFYMSRFFNGENWYTVAIDLFEDGNHVDSESFPFSVFTNMIEPSYGEMIIFGDSLSDIGNVKDSIMNLPAVPPYWQGRFSNGPVWAELVASELGLTLNHGTGTQTGNNRAYGGSQSGQGYSYILLPNTGTQINNFLSYVQSSFNSSDLVVVWGGGNDFLYGLGSGNITLSNMVSHVEAVIAAGAQNILVPNLPPLELTPEARNRSTNQQQQIGSEINIFNAGFAPAMQALATTHSVNIIYVDTHAMFYRFLHNASYLGLTNIVDMACESSGSILPLPICNAGDPVVSNVDEYVFFDKAHPTAAMHRLISMQAMQALGIPDRDDDGVGDDIDTCPWTDAGRIANQTGCSYEQEDDDGDGVQNSLDDCPQTIAGEEVDSVGCSATQRDSDGDGMMDDLDPCPYSPSGADHDHDGCVNEEDEDDDNDGILDDVDNCPRGAVGWTSTSVNDIDGDGCRDIDEDTDDDGDGLSDVEEYQRGTDQSLWDTDGDGVNDKDDAFPLDSSQWNDSDGDGYGDNPLGDHPDSHPEDPSQWNDSDGDGYGDNLSGSEPDLFPFDLSQWFDRDGDGFGDNPDGFEADACPDVFGTSIVPPGCPDRDGDGYSDDADAFADDPEQQLDRDQDGYGDNPGFQFSDVFADDPSEWNDSDGDGYGDNAADAFPDDPLEWNDTDGDGCGDNSDLYPTDPGECLDYDGDGIGDNADAFRRDASEWSDFDGDGYGDNIDAFPRDASDWKDSDGNGIGDNLQAKSEHADSVSTELIFVIALAGVVALIFMVQRRQRPKGSDSSESWVADENDDFQ